MGSVWYKEHRTVPHASLAQAETCAANARRYYGEDAVYENHASVEQCYGRNSTFTVQSEFIMLMDLNENKELGDYYRSSNPGGAHWGWIIPPGQAELKRIDDFSEWQKIVNEYMTDKD